MGCSVADVPASIQNKCAGHSRKFDKPWVEPFKIVKKVVSKLVYRIQHFNLPQKLFVVHFNYLKPYKATKEVEKENAPPYDLVE